jgi:hypothetical protein
MPRGRATGGGTSFRPVPPDVRFVPEACRPWTGRVTLVTAAVGDPI